MKKKRRKIRWDRVAILVIGTCSILFAVTFGIVKIIGIQKQNRENVKVNMIIDGNRYQLNGNQFLDYTINKSLPDIIEEPVTLSLDVKTPQELFTSIGEFRLTGYCNCEECCGQWAGGPTYSGVMPTSQHTIATDKDIIPMGTHVLINGVEYVAEDTGSAIIGNRIDIYCDTHEECFGDFCNGYAEVYIINE